MKAYPAFRVVVTGSRKFQNKDQVWARMDELLAEHPGLEVAHGASKGGGVDSYVAEWAQDRGVTETPYPVRSGPTGIDGNHRGAPLKRNRRMVRSFMPDLTVAFRSPGVSNGTDNCCQESLNIGVDVEINHEHA